jgi:hypothetical protein
LPEAERRRIGKVVHDDRGNASVRWVDAPADYQRPVLELAGDGAPAHQRKGGFTPYAPGATRTTATSTRTDLRKLSEWIKMMRELEARKRNGGDQDGGAGGAP